MSMEFVMGKSLESLPKTIDFNFEELKGQLSEALKLYTGLVVTEDSIKAAKEDRAKLNKLREALEAKRREVKKECMAPYTEFEGKVKELVALIDQPIAAIDGQLKGYENQRREAKQAEITAIYQECMGGLAELVPLERIWEDAWYNVSVTLKKVKESIYAISERIAADMAVLETVESEFMEPVKLKYLETLDLNAALRERARLQERAEHLRQYEATTMAAKAPEPDPHEPTFEPGGGAAVEEPTPVPEEEKVYLLRFECQITKAQAASLSKFLKDNNISYRRI